MSDISKDDPRSVKMEAWTLLSRRLAAGAQGEVNVILGEIEVPREKVVRLELEELGNNPNVTAIHLHQLKESPTGAYKDAKGRTYDLEPISMAEALGLKPKPVVVEVEPQEEEESSS
jgi:hypothetical protein